MKAASNLFFIAIVFALLLAARAADIDERYTVRNRRARVRDSAAVHNGNVRRGNNKKQDSIVESTVVDPSSFSSEQLNTYRRLGITCGVQDDDGYDDDGYGKEGGKYGYDDDAYGKEGGKYGYDDDGYGKEGGKEGSKDDDYYGKYGRKDGSKEGSQGRRRRRRQRRNRRLAMRAFTYHRAGECICDEELGVCWIWGDQHDDPICCKPDGMDHFPVASPVSAPVQSPVAPPASLNPPLDERTWSNDMPTFVPAGF